MVKEWVSYLPSKYLYENYELDIADRLHTLELDYLANGGELSEDRLKWAKENLPNIETIYDEEVQNEVYIEPNYPHIRYFKDGFTYIINGYRTLVLGGAYSVDKKIQVARGGWFESEQLTEKEKAFIYTKIKGQDFDFILSHTCPVSIEPIDLFISCVTQSEVDKSMECWLEEVKNNCNWKIWCFGHFHADRLERPRMEMFYTDISPIEEIHERWKEKEDEVEPDWWLEKSPQYYWD